MGLVEGKIAKFYDFFLYASDGQWTVVILVDCWIISHFKMECHFVSGYNSMGYEMSKPDLRAELEADLKLVSEGRKDKAAVLSYHVAKYKAVFIESVRKAKK